MKNKWFWISMIIVGVIGAVVGVFFALKNNHLNVEKDNQDKVENQIGTERIENLVIATIEQEEKVVPNTIMQKRIYYTVCDHLIEQAETIAPSDVNQTEEEIEDKYNKWKLEEFSKEKIVLYQERQETCPQHFQLLDFDGVIAIRQMNPEGEYEVVDKTEISTKYLPEEDQEKLKQGIGLIGEEKLNQALEDYE